MSFLDLSLWLFRYEDIPCMMTVYCLLLGIYLYFMFRFVSKKCATSMHYCEHLTLAMIIVAI